MNLIGGHDKKPPIYRYEGIDSIIQRKYWKYWKY